MLDQSNCTSRDMKVGYLAGKEFTVSQAATHSETSSTEQGFNVCATVEAGIPIAKAVTGAASLAAGYNWTTTNTMTHSTQNVQEGTARSQVTASPVIPVGKKLLGTPTHDTIRYKRAQVSHSPTYPVFASGTMYSSGVVYNPTGGIHWREVAANCE